MTKKNREKRKIIYDKSRPQATGAGKKPKKKKRARFGLKKIEDSDGKNQKPIMGLGVGQRPARL